MKRWMAFLVIVFCAFDKACAEEDTLTVKSNIKSTIRIRYNSLEHPTTDCNLNISKGFKAIVYFGFKPTIEEGYIWVSWAPEGVPDLLKRGGFRCVLKPQQNYLLEFNSKSKDGVVSEIKFTPIAKKTVSTTPLD